MSLHQEAQEADTLILSFSSGIIDTNSHISMLAQSNKRERKSNANQLLDHRKITAAPNLIILETESPKYCFQLQDKEPFPTETYCHLCCALLAWATARCLVVTYWQNCSYMVYPTPTHMLWPNKDTLAWPTCLFLPEPDLMLNWILACSSGSSDLYCAPVRGMALN